MKLLASMVFIIVVFGAISAPIYHIEKREVDDFNLVEGLLARSSGGSKSDPPGKVSFIQRFRGFRQRIISAVTKPKLPPSENGYEWECNINCPIGPEFARTSADRSAVAKSAACLCGGHWRPLPSSYKWPGEKKRQDTPAS